VLGASIGTAVFKEGGASYGELTGAADAALYGAKTERVVSLRIGADMDATGDGHE
jgi:predicted signal transduction protein with EAL and GGDEF domain